MFINFAKNQTDGEENEDVASYPREFAISEPPYRDEDAGPRASFVRLSDYPRFGDVEVWISLKKNEEKKFWFLSGNCPF